MSKFRLTIHHDDDAGHMDPFGDDFEGGLFQLHSFNSRHHHFTNPDELICVNCLCYMEDHPVLVDEDESEEIECDDFNPGPGFWLSYYEHGLAHWSVQGTVTYPDMQWDGVRTAGFLQVVPDVVPETPTAPDDDPYEYWNSLTEDQRLEMAKSMMETYTDWINGNVYGYTLESIREEVCNLGETHIYSGEDVDDSCWGFIGDDFLAQEVREVTAHFGATAENTIVVDKAYGTTDYMNLFREESNA